LALFCVANVAFLWRTRNIGAASAVLLFFSIALLSFLLMSGGVDHTGLYWIYFDPFFQVDASATRRHGGTGLGLAISHHLVQLMGGNLRCESTLNVGTTFHCELLFEKTDDPDAASGQGEETAKRGAPTDVPILLAEDNAVNRKVCLKQLEQLGYEAEAVANGEEAIAELRKKRCALVLMDCQMPLMDGYETTRRIRTGAAGDGNTDIVVIAMTAHAMKGDREQCLSAGMNDYITKPVRMDVLRAVLDKWLR